MNRNERVRAASGSVKGSVRQAAEVVGPYAVTAKDSARQYAQEAGTYLKPHARRAAELAKEHYDAHLAARVEHARGTLPNGVHFPNGMEDAALRAAERTRSTAHKARAAAGPRLEQALAAAGPAREEAAARSTAAMAALRGEVTAKEVDRLVRRRRRRARTGRAVKWIGVTGLLAGGAVVAWKWWDRQTNPDWLVEPPPPTELSDFGPPAEETRKTPLEDEVKSEQPDTGPGALAAQKAKEAAEKAKEAAEKAKGAAQKAKGARNGDGTGEQS
ncbi:DUF5324 family protein [Streptomyces sp. ACA25]|uniref:DUF5324 family protein n=1 Tax=Streptomyces sp. ACA25 TaxID=3022596 RepID=UPI003FA6E7BB